MDRIYECAKNYSKLIKVKYDFVISKSRKLKSFTLDFLNTDLYHIVGFQYLSDIDINKDRARTIDIILNEKINDELLNKSSFFKSDITNECDIQSRVNNLIYLEKYLDTDNMIKIFTTRQDKKLSSNIKAEYFIESRLPKQSHSVYIFLRKRKESDTYCIVSFFQKGTQNYGGEAAYWMQKVKIVDGDSTVLFQHKNYKTT